MQTLQRWVLILGVSLAVLGVLLSVVLPYFHPVTREARAIHVGLLYDYGLDAESFVDRNVQLVPLWPVLFVIATMVALIRTRRAYSRRSLPLGRPTDQAGKPIKAWERFARSENPYLFAAGIQAIGLGILAWRSLMNIGSVYNTFGYYLIHEEYADGWVLVLQAYLVPVLLNIIPLVYLWRESFTYLRKNPLVWFPTLIVVAEFIMYQGFLVWSIRINILQHTLG